MKTRTLRVLLLAGVLFGAAHSNPSHAESSHDAWLRYAPVGDRARGKHASLPATVVAEGESPRVETAQQDLVLRVESIPVRTLRAENVLPREAAIVLRTVSSLPA